MRHLSQFPEPLVWKLKTVLVLVLRHERRRRPLPPPEGGRALLPVAGHVEHGQVVKVLARRGSVGARGVGAGVVVGGRVDPLEVLDDAVGGGQAAAARQGGLERERSV